MAAWVDVTTGREHEAALSVLESYVLSIGGALERTTPIGALPSSRLPGRRR